MTKGASFRRRTDLNKAVVELDRVSGTIFEKNGNYAQRPMRNTEIPTLLHQAGVSDDALPADVRKMLYKR